MRFSTTLSIASLALTAQAWHLTFYAGVQCRSANLGGLDIALNDPCRDAKEFNGIAQSVFISIRDGDRPQDGVAFFSDDQCSPSTGVAIGDGGCLGVGSGVVDFATIKVLGGDKSFNSSGGGGGNSTAAVRKLR